MQDIIPFIQEHWALGAVLLVILILLMILEFIKLRRATASLKPQQVVQLINHQNAVVVDLRSAEAFKSGHIVNALSISFSELNDQYKKLEKLKTQPIVLVCAAGTDSSRAATLLIQHGITHLYILAGGMRAWREADMPVVKE